MNDTPVPQKLDVDLSETNGAVKHGAAGFLYGLGNNGIPSVNMLAPLKPQVAAQKPEGGLQHPNGDALDVSGTYLAAGGREIEIYLQDVYSAWPYETLGLDDYLARIDPIIRQVAAHPNRGVFSYVPFNEPDQIWYNISDKKETFFADWKTTYEKIKAIDPAARIVGPNLANYSSGFYRDFMAYASANHCLPEVISWHELNDAFFGGWYNRYEDYRAIERDLGIAAQEICINEYARISGDLGIPGKLVQWIARFENSKVDACLAYWTSAGCLNDLVVRDTENKATGGWWLYKWYGSLTGSTVKVTPPDANAEGLQGLAALDGSKKQARVLFGGASGDANIVIRGFETTPYFASKVHVSLWAAASSGVDPSGGPTLVMAEEYAITSGMVSIPVKNMVDTTAYQMIITPEQGQPPAASPHRYEAQYADLSGSARINYGSPGSPHAGFVEGYAGSSDASTSFVITALDNGYHDIRLTYAAGPGEGLPAEQVLSLILNGVKCSDLILPAAAGWNTWAEKTIRAFLPAGINRIAFDACSGDNRGKVRISCIEVARADGPVQVYEAEAAENTLAGTASIVDDPAASGGKYVGGIGGGAGSYLQFNNITTAGDGPYRMVITFANAEFRGGHAYNSQVVDRFAEISVNGEPARKVYFRNTFAWNHYQTKVVDVELKAGSNTIRFFNSAKETYAPHIDKIAIAGWLI